MHLWGEELRHSGKEDIGSGSGLAADIKIVEGEKLRKYILDYQKHIAKL